MSEEKSFGSMIRMAREALGLTQEELGAKLSPAVSRTTVIRWEKDEQQSRPGYRKQLVEILGFNEAEADAFYRAAGEAPPPPQEIENLPQENLFFTGREVILDRLHGLLEGKSRIVVLSGLAGIGKTQIATKYAYRHYPKIYRTALWVDATNETTLQASYAALAHLLDLPERYEQDAVQYVSAVKRWLQGHKDWLIIMDNADDVGLARSYLPAKLTGHVILTSTSQIVGNIGRLVKVGPMRRGECMLFLLRRSGLLRDDQTLTATKDMKDSCARIIELLDCHPLAINQAGAFIEETGSSFASYIDLYQKNRRSMLDRPGSLRSDHPETVAVSLDTSIKSAIKRHPLALDVLAFCAFVRTVIQSDTLLSYDDQLNANPLALKEAIAALRRYSLIDYEQRLQGFSMHQMVLEIVEDSLPTDVKMQWKKRVIRAVSAALSAEDSDLDSTAGLIMAAGCSLSLTREPTIFYDPSLMADFITMLKHLPIGPLAQYYDALLRDMGYVAETEALENRSKPPD